MSTHTLLLVIIVLLLAGGIGWGYPAARGPYGIIGLVITILVIVLLFRLLGLAL